MARIRIKRTRPLSTLHLLSLRVPHIRRAFLPTVMCVRATAVGRQQMPHRVTIPDMATVQYESKENAGHRFWTARYGRYAIRIDANRPGVYRWLISLEGRLVRNGVAPGRDHAAEAVSEALDELSR
jgi:hypothetical protein